MAVASEPNLELACDYLVVGADMCSLAFTGALLARAAAAGRPVSVIIADEKEEPGGPWLDAPSFARVDRSGLWCPARPPRGPSAREVKVHCGKVMDDFVSSGHVRYFPKSIVSADGVQLASCVDPTNMREVVVRRKIVSSFSAWPQPHCVRRPPFDVEAGMEVVQPSCLPALTVPYSRYVIIGAGRTGMDTVLWLLSRRVRPEKVWWVVPRDAWLLRREALQPGQLERVCSALQQAAAESHSIEELLEKLEQVGLLGRVDRNRQQSTLSSACASREELDQLRKVPNIVRLGHVRRVTSERLVLEHGSVATGEGTLHVDCTRPRAAQETAPIFTDKRILLQQVGELFAEPWAFNEALSAMLIGQLEALYPEKQAKKNALCTPLAMPDTPIDWLRAHLHAWKHPKLWQDERHFDWNCGLWLASCSELGAPLGQLMDPSRSPSLQAACENVEKLLQEHSSADLKLRFDQGGDDCNLGSTGSSTAASSPRSVSSLSDSGTA